MIFFSTFISLSKVAEWSKALTKCARKGARVRDSVEDENV